MPRPADSRLRSASPLRSRPRDGSRRHGGEPPPREVLQRNWQSNRTIVAIVALALLIPLAKHLVLSLTAH